MKPSNRARRHVCATLVLTLLLSYLPQSAHLAARVSAAANTANARPQALHSSTRDAAALASARQSYGSLPLSFEKNIGQADPSVKFLVRGAAGTTFLTETEAVFVLPRAGSGDAARDNSGGRSLTPKQRLGSARMRAARRERAEASNTVVRLRFEGASAGAGASGLEELPGKVNYFRGSDARRWVTDVPTFGRVRYESVYPGVDLVYYGNRRELEYDFEVAPGANPAAVALKFEGADGVSVEGETGDLLVSVGGKVLRQRKPVVYQEVDGKRRAVSGGYMMKGGGRVGFSLGAYDRSNKLVIDPVISYSSYLGGLDEDLAHDVTVDADGNAYVVGNTQSVDFPVKNAIQSSNHGGGCECGSGDAFVAKVNADGSALLWATYLGGHDDDVAFGVAVDSASNVVVTGLSYSPDFPFKNAMQSTNGSIDPFCPICGYITSDAFVAKIAAAGNKLTFSTLLGGVEDDGGRGVAVGADGDIYVAGFTDSFDFPTTDPVQPYLNNARTLSESSMTCCEGDGFLTKIASDGQSRVYSTFVGGSRDDAAMGVAVDGEGSAYITGLTYSTQFDPKATPSPTPTPEPDNRIQEFTLPKARSAPYAITAGPDGNLWFTELNAFRIGRVTPSGVFTEYDIPSGTTANDITAGPDGNIWFTERGSTLLGRIIPATGAVAEFPVNATNPPNGITAGPDGNIWFTEELSAAFIGRFTPPAGSARPPPSPTPAGEEFAISNTATRITKGPDNNLWFTEYNTDLFGRAEPGPTPVIAEFSNGAGGGAITAGPDGDLWYTGQSQPVIGRIVPTLSPTFTEYTIPSADFATFIAAGPDGKLWFTENEGGKIGNITPTASPSPTPINELHTPTSNSGPNGITAGPDGNIWFTMTRVNKIGRYALNPATPLPTPTPTPSPTPRELFPTTPGAFQESPAGTGFSEDAFVTKLNPSGSDFVYSTYVGGSGDEESLGIALGADGSAYITGYTNSPAGTGRPCEETPADAKTMTHTAVAVATPTPDEYPTTANAYQKHNNGGTDCGGPRAAKSRGGDGGTDAFLTRLNAAGSALIYSTYFGGSENEGSVDNECEYYDASFDGADVAVDFQGKAYITGETASTNFPVKNAFKATAGGDDPEAFEGADDAYVAKFDTDASGEGSLVYSSYLGGSFEDVGYGIAVDSAANAYVTGSTYGNVVCTREDLITPGHPEDGKTCVEYAAIDDFPTTPGVFQPDYKGGYFLSNAFSDAFITKIGGGAGGSENSPTFSVTGRVTGPGGGGGVGGVTITVTQGDATVATTTTDAGGFYTVNGLAPGGYVVTPSGGGYIFSPPNQPVAISTQNVRADFTATRVYTISGRVVTGSAGLGGVTITVTKQNGSEVGTTTTDDNGNYQFANLPQGDYFVTPSKPFYSFTPPNISVQELTSDRTGLDFAATPLPGAIQFSVVAADTARNEGAGKFLIKVTRNGIPSAPASVEYATHDGSAEQRSDYTIALGVLSFAAGEVEKTIPVFIVDDAFQEADESFTLTLSNPTGGATLGDQTTVALTIVDNDAAPATASNNPIDGTTFFVRQHYLDFLNREPDAEGLAFWVNGIESCGADAGCREVKRIETSAAFFLSIEFQQTGYFVYRLYRGPLARQPDYLEFMRDTQAIGRNLVVGATGWEQQLDANTQRFAEDFVARPEFVARYPLGTTAAAYVDALYSSEGVTPTTAERDQAVAAYGSGDPQGRARALRVVVNNQTFTRRLTNEGFVAAEYFGYLRRNPDDPGFNFWLNKLNSFNGDFRAAEMVKAFLISDEYRKRFGQ